MSEESALQGTPLQIEFEGFYYKINLITGKVKADFEQRFAARERSKVEDRRKKYGLSRKEFLEELRRIDEREGRGEFALLGAAAIQSAITVEWGRKMLLELLMPDCPKDVLPRIMDERSDNLGWLLLKVLEDSMADTIKKGKEKQSPFRPDLGVVSQESQEEDLPSADTA